MAFRFLHLADLHLETAFGGRAEATRERLRSSVLEAFERAVDVAIERDCHALLAAGDLFDDPLLSTRTELFFVRQVRRLSEAGIWFLACAGNHDPGSSTHRLASFGWTRAAAADEAFDETAGTASAMADESWLDRVHLFLEPVPHRVEVTDRDGHPVGQVVGAGHASSTEDSNLASAFPDVRGDLPIVGLLHTQVATAHRAAEHDRYAPSTADDYRQRAAYSYWAIGHVHLRQQAIEGLPVWYAGNLQGRNPREHGPKGGLVVEAHAGTPAEPEFVRLAPVRWLRLAIGELAELESVDTLRRQLAARIEHEREPGEELIVVLELEGPTPLASRLRDREERAGLEDELAQEPGVLEVWIDAGATTRVVDREALERTPSVLGEALALVEQARSDRDVLAQLVPSTLAGGSRSVDSDADEHLGYVAELARGIETELWERCLDREVPLD